jgi:plasmid stability protein
MHMSKMIQIRNVPDLIHRKLKVRAAEEGLSLSDYLLREVRGLAERPSVEELLNRLSRRSPVRTRMSPTQALRKEREGR